MGKPGTIAVWIVGIVLVAILAAMVWQHLRYQDARRNAVHDLQDAFHSSAVLHGVLFLKLAPDTDLFDAMRALRAATDALPGARTVYAGKVAMNGLASSQMVEALGEDVDWDAVALVQFDDRGGYDRWRGDEAVRAAMRGFETTYTHGMQRAALANLGLVQAFLFSRVMQAVTFQPSVLPFEPAPPDAVQVATNEQRATMLEERELGREAVFVANLIKTGTPEEATADARYSGAMMAAMARGGHGPLHMGTAVTLEGDASFDRVAFVYYPGVQYFHDLTGSTFFRNIIGDKRLGDTQSTVTVPILHLL
ncbi:MAG: DUF4381 domain-containing protein [Gammaproteobacteria bacterium]|nr:DUF4381 domain-containing protein [Gammaproteobacteria bacterium]